MSRWKSPALPGTQKQKTTNNLRIKYKEKYKEKQVICDANSWMACFSA